jgi:short-subunit dehydrogenase
MSPDELAARYGPWALIAGGSEGLGAAFADRLAAQGMKLILLARKREPLEALAAELRERHGAEVLTLAQDLTAPDAVEAILTAIGAHEIGLLVYNAGADSGVADFLERPPAALERMIALNVSTPMLLVRQLAPRMAARGKGGVLLVSTFVSVVGTPGNALYASTKAFGNVFAEGMWHELGEHGIDVLSVIVGIVRTPAMERMGMTFEGVTTPADPCAIADEALANLDRGPTFHAGGTYDEVQRLRTLPRDEAVRAIAAFSKAAQATARP